MVTGRRNAILAISMTASTLISGFILDHLVYPHNYQVVFLIGAIGGYLSAYHLSRLRQDNLEPPIWETRQFLPRRSVERLSAGRPSSNATNGKSLVRFDLLRSAFGLFLLAFLAFYAFQYLPLPLFPLIFVNELQLTDGMISLGSALFYLVMFLVSLQLTRIAGRFGHHRTLVGSALGYGIYPLMIGIARGPSMYYAASLVGGGFWGIASASLVNRLMEKAPDEDRPAYMTLHNLTLNAGILIGSLSGPLLGDWIGLQPASIVSGVLRFIAGFLLGIWG
jgi:MFS family permease